MDHHLSITLMWLCLVAQPQGCSIGYKKKKIHLIRSLCFMHFTLISNQQILSCSQIFIIREFGRDCNSWFTYCSKGRRCHKILEDYWVQGWGGSLHKANLKRWLIFLNILLSHIHQILEDYSRLRPANIVIFTSFISIWQRFLFLFWGGIGMTAAASWYQRLEQPYWYTNSNLFLCFIYTIYMIKVISQWTFCVCVCDTHKVHCDTTSIKATFRFGIVDLWSRYNYQWCHASAACSVHI